MGSSKKQTTGYWYKMGLHLGLCHGPIDQLQEISGGDRVAWNGQRYAVTTSPLGGLVITPTTSGPVTGNEQIFINALELYGGKKREGGIQGYMDVMMGAADQGANDYLTAKQGSPQSAYRGIVSLVYRGGFVAANNPYIKPWAFRVRRVLQGWDGSVWYPEKAAIDVTEPATGGGMGGPVTVEITGMNPAHIIYECLTNREWGLGYPAGKLDLPTFAAAADVFHAEGLGLCMQWQRQESIQNFVQVVCDHAGAALGEDPRTGLWRLRAIRDDYDIGTLPVFSAAAGNIISLDSFERASPTETINELTITFNDIKTAKEGSVTVHHLANITAQGAVVPQSRSYPGIPTTTLAGRIASRDLRTAAAGIARLRFTATRAAYGLLPGDVVAFSWPELGVALMAIRIGRINYGDLTKGEIQIEAVEDIFGLPDSTYVKPPPIDWQDPDREPVASPNVAAFEVPFRDVVQTVGAANAAALPASSGFLGAVARKPSGLSIDYELRTKIGAAPYTEAGDGTWAPTATLAAGINRTATSVTLASVIDLDQVAVGDACLIGTEVCRVDSLNVLTNAVTVGRGCADTVPQAWPLGTRVWFYDSFAAADATEYVAGDAVDAKFITRTTGGELPEADAPTASVTMASRAARPYPPGRLRINGAAYPDTITGPLVLTWAHRDRLLQQDTLVDAEETDIGPEAGTTYRVRLYDQTGALRRTATVTGNSYTWSTESADSGLVFGALPTEITAGITFSQSSTYASGLSADATNMRDGVSTNGGATNSSASEWIRADLGSAKTVSRVAVAGGNLPIWGQVALHLNGRVIQWSSDGTTWTTVATISGVDDTGTLFNFNFTPVTARYWRISSTSFLSTTEFRIYEDLGGVEMLNSQVRIRLEAERAGLASWTEYDFTVQRIIARLTEDGEDRLTEEGELRILE